MNELIPLVAQAELVAEADESGATPSAVQTNLNSPESRSIVRLEFQGAELMNSDLHTSIVVDFDLHELQARIDALIDEAGPVYQFDACQLSTGLRQLLRNGHEIHLRPKVYRLLTHLIERRSRAVSRDELCQVVWNGRCVGNATVDSTVKALRSAIGDDGSAQRLVQTISGYGYRFVAAVKATVPDKTVLRTSLACQTETVELQEMATGL